MGVWFSAPGRWVVTPLGCRHPLWGDLCPGECWPTQAGLSLLDTLFSPLRRVSLLLVSRRLPINSGHKRVVAFVLFAQGSANRSVCLQVWKEHLVVQ